MPTERKPRELEPQTKRSSRGLIIGGFVCVIAAIIAVGAAVCMVLLNRQDAGETSKKSTGTIVQMPTVGNVSKVAAGYYEVNMNTTWNFPDGQSVSEDAVISNSETNNSDVYVTLTLKDTGEQILETDIIPLGCQINNIILDKDLDAGKYTAVCTYHMVDEEGSEIDSLSVTVTINILE